MEMALRIAQIFGILALTSLQAQTIDYPVRHKRAAVDCGGRLTFEDTRIAYHGLCGKGDKEQLVTWSYEDAQRLELYPARIVLRGYPDRKWLAGADEVYDFRLEGKVELTPLYRHLRARMDDRLIARFPYAEGEPLWRIPAKLPAKWQGAQGTLALHEWGLVFASTKPGASRTWTDAALLNISSSHPRELAINTAEAEFAFQLKRNLKPEEYDRLWFRLNRPRGLQLIPHTQGDSIK
jgi:hypothetical protein